MLDQCRGLNAEPLYMISLMVSRDLCNMYHNCNTKLVLVLGGIKR